MSPARPSRKLLASVSVNVDFQCTIAGMYWSSMRRSGGEFWIWEFTEAGRIETTLRDESEMVDVWTVKFLYVSAEVGDVAAVVEPRFENVF